MKIISVADLEDSVDPIKWLNGRIERDCVTADKLESFLNSLQLSLSLLAQECADSDDILSAQYLAQMPALAVDVERMFEETASASARLEDLAGFKMKQEKSLKENNPFDEILKLTAAIEKVEIAKKGFKRGKRSLK